MSVNPPPNPNVDTFNNLYWTPDELDTAAGDLRYLRFPTAQGTETLQAVNVNGVATLNGAATFNGNVNFNTAYMGGTPVNTLTINDSLVTTGPINLTNPTGTRLYYNDLISNYQRPVTYEDTATYNGSGVFNSGINMNGTSISNMSDIYSVNNQPLYLRGLGTGTITFIQNGNTKMSIGSTNISFVDTPVVACLSFTSKNNTDMTLAGLGTGAVILSSGGSNKLGATNSGVTLIGSALYDVGSISCLNNNNFPINAVGTGHLQLRTAGVNRIVIDDTGITTVNTNLNLSNNQLYNVGEIIGQNNTTLPIKALGTGVINLMTGGITRFGVGLTSITSSLNLNLQANDLLNVGVISGETNQDLDISSLGTGTLNINTGGSNRINITSSGDFSSVCRTLFVTGTLNTNAKVRMGLNTGTLSQGNGSVAVGGGCGTTQLSDCVAIGNNAGLSQADNAIAIGNNAAGVLGQQRADAIAIGTNAGSENQLGSAIAIGNNAGGTNQGIGSVAIGASAGITSQSSASASNSEGSVAIGSSAGSTNQGIRSVAIGSSAGQTTQALNSTAIGYGAGNSNQATLSVAIGDRAGQTTQSTRSVAIGALAGQTTQGADSVAIGYNAGNSQAANTVAIGSGSTTTGAASVAVGRNAVASSSGNSVAIGDTAKAGTNGVSIGTNAGGSTPNASSVAIGVGAGSNIANGSVCIGFNASTSAGGNLTTNSIFIGNAAVSTTAISNSIVLNATGSAINPLTVSAFYVNPVRNTGSAGLALMYYNSSTKEIGYDSSARRFKKDIEDLVVDTSVLHKFSPKSFKFISHQEDAKTNYGFIAEDLEELNPLLVSYNDEGLTQGINWNTITMFNIGEIQALRKEVDELKAIVKLLLAKV